MGQEKYPLLLQYKVLTNVNGHLKVKVKRKKSNVSMYEWKYTEKKSTDILNAYDLGKLGSRIIPAFPLHFKGFVTLSYNLWISP